MARLMTVALVALVAVPSAALAQGRGPYGQPVEEYGPGITVSGTGFAPHGERATATARAVADARVRAESIASALSVALGEVRSIELRTPFEPRRECQPGDDRRRCNALDAVTTEVTFEIAGGPTSDEGAREITGTGTAVAPVDAPRKTSASIRHGLREARRAATPDAANMARANAETAAAAAGMTLGALFSVVDSTASLGYDPVVGAFGPGQFCAKFRRSRLVRDPQTGERRVVRGKRRLRCYRQRALPVVLEVTYLGA